MIVQIICDYCGHKWEKQVYIKAALEDLKCQKCGDKHIKFKDLDENKIDYYQGSPPFEIKIDTSNDY